MSEPTEITPEIPTWSEETDPHHVTRADLHAKDWMLEDLILLITGLDDGSESRISMTVGVGGVVYSGEVMSRKAFRSAVRETFEYSPSPEGAEMGSVLDRLWGSSIDRADEILTERDEKDLPRLARRYMHMKDASIVGTDLHLTAIRIALEDVTSWSIGSFKSN